MVWSRSKKHFPTRVFAWMMTFSLVWIIQEAHAASSFEGMASSLDSCDPISDFIRFSDDEPDLEFCSEWNPEFSYIGHRCCQVKKFYGRRKKGPQCAPDRRKKQSFCDEMTLAQRQYSEDVQSGKIADVLTFLEGEMSKQRVQAVCGPSNGFLAWGKQLVPSLQNRIQIRRPDRCVDFGTDSLVAALEWLGRQIAKGYSTPEFEGVRMIVGDLSAPRGGCVSGYGGRRSHSSHTSGLDADIAFLSVKKNQLSSNFFDRHFDANVNLWFLKKLFSNPYACVKVVFVDKRLIRKLEKEGRKDPEWLSIRSHVRHVSGHRNHFHIRVGEKPGKPGCPDEALELDDPGEDDILSESLGGGVNEPTLKENSAEIKRQISSGG